MFSSDKGCLVVNEILIDVVMPTYERFDVFVRAATSVREAVFSGIVNKLIVADDSITSDIEDWCLKEAWIDYKRVLNRNPGLNRNDCALRSQADYVLFLDSDNYIDNFIGLRRLKEIVELLKPDVVSISCGEKFTAANYVNRGIHWVKKHYYFNIPIGEVQHLVHREVLLKNPYIVLKGYLLDAPDYLWSRILFSSSHLFFPDVVQKYSLSSDSISIISYSDKAEPQIFNYVNVLRTNWSNGNWLNYVTFMAFVKVLFYNLIRKQNGR